jgi:sigma-B regulation protein RsbU (phosphoserine phosphatase)
MHKERGVPVGSPQDKSRRSTHYRIWVVALGAAVLLVALEVPLALKIPHQAYTGLILNNMTVARVAPESPAGTAGVTKGDQVISINGSRCVTPESVSNRLQNAGPGDTIAYGVLRGGRHLVMPVRLSRLPPAETLRRVSMLVVGFSFIAIGLLVYFRRHDKVAMVFYLLSLAFGLALTNIVTTEIGSASPLHRYVLNDLMVLFMPALFLHFFLIFPERPAVLVRHPRLEGALYTPAALMFGASLYLNIMIFSRGGGFGDLITALRNATAAYFISFIVAGLVAFFYAYRHVSSDSARSKLRLVLWGTIAGTLPLIFVRVILSIRPAVEVPGEKLVFLPLMLVPLAFGHAIVRYGLLDLEIVIRRSLVYTLLVGALASIYFIVVYGIGRVASTFIGSNDLFFSVASIFVITLLISPLKVRIKTAVDKVFFRQEYTYRKVIKQISHTLAGIINLESLVSYLAIRIAEVLDAGSVVIFLLDERTGMHTARYGTGVGHTMLSPFDKGGTLCTHLHATQTAFNIERMMGSRGNIPLSKAETETLLRAGAALVVPFISKSELLGFVAIGNRCSDQHYSAMDVELLETLCDQVSLAIENASLYLQAVEKQKMEQELEVAREIQRRLLPKSLPQVPGLETHALNIPSKHVGGDFYDVIPLSPDSVGLVIADVSGKGVPAALLMASLQSSLRAEARPGRRPSEVISALNKVIYEHTAGGTFITIFYGVLDFYEATITYCNAGQSPPVLVHHRQVVRQLDNTDIVIGVDEDAVYRNSVVPLHEGELLFLYTDGITDELDERDEPYGEARLISELARIHEKAPSAIAECIHDDVLRHTAGKPQDDLTLLVVRVLELAGRPGGVSPAKNP